ncbi:MAG: hypothetical protein AAFX93_13645 [Verrucomicrobiota bacterium]
MNGNRREERRKQRLIKNGVRELSRYQKRHGVTCSKADAQHLKVQVAHPLIRILSTIFGLILVGVSSYMLVEEANLLLTCVPLVFGTAFIVLGIRGRKKELGKFADATFDGGAEAVLEIVGGMIDGL